MKPRLHQQQLNLNTMAKIILVSAANSFTLNGIEYQKGSLSVNHSTDGVSIGGTYADLADITVNGATPASISALKTWISTNCFKSGGGAPSEGVQSVTGNIVDDSDPNNPVIDFPIGDNRQVPIYKDGEIVADRLGWSQFSDLPTPPPFLNGLLAGTAFNENGSALFAFIELALGATNESIAKPNAIPLYNPGQIGTGGGTLPVADGIEDGDAMNVGQLMPLLNGRLSTMRIVNVTATRSFALTDLGINSILRCHGIIDTLTIPLDATLNFPVGSIIKIVSTSSTTTIAAASGVDLVSDNGDLVLSGNKSATLIKMASNSWFLSRGL